MLAQPTLGGKFLSAKSKSGRPFDVSFKYIFKNEYHNKSNLV